MQAPYLISRRSVLQSGAIGYLGLCLPRLLQAERAAAESGRAASADAAILIFLNGGPSHLDMWDMKPEAPVELRGEFQPISTTVPGVQLCEHLPRLARLVHHTTILRSVHHSVNNSHAAAVYAALTGHDRGEKGGGARPTDNPAIGSVVGKLFSARRADAALRRDAVCDQGRGRRAAAARLFRRLAGPDARSVLRAPRSEPARLPRRGSFAARGREQ